MLTKHAGKKIKASATALVVSALVACGGGGGGSGENTPARTLTSIEIAPTNPFISAVSSQQLTATGHYSDSTTSDLTKSVTWGSSASAVISVNSSGAATFVKVGGSTITATDAATGLQGSLSIAERHVVFVTSTTGTGDLSSWAGANGNTGLAAGDAVCQARATAAGLNGIFVAWLSDSTNDAYCRVQGLSGKRSANCGQAVLPSVSGPWVRMDGYPFAAGLSELANNGPYTPVKFDETGARVSNGIYVFTGTLQTGAVATNHCSDWTSTLVTSAGGVLTNTRFDWTESASSFSCGSVLRLMCIQRDNGPALPVFAMNQAKRAFVTSVTGNGNLAGWADAGGASGISAGDAICRARATAAGVANAVKFKAWLSDSSINAIDRFTSNGPWARLDGVLLASSKSSLVDTVADGVNGNLFTSLNQDETGAYHYYTTAWTGSDLAGAKTAQHCTDWTSNAGNPASGTASSATNGQFLSDGFSAGWCNNSSLSLYCLEDD